jgi:hypothetical protein
LYIIRSNKEELTLRRFVEDILPPSVALAELAHPLKSPPPLNWIKAYLGWRGKTAQARVGSKIAETTMRKELQQLLRFVKLGANHTYNMPEINELKSVSFQPYTRVVLDG